MVFSILSLQCTVQELGIRTEDIQGCRSAKRTVCVCVRRVATPARSKTAAVGLCWKKRFGGSVC